MGLLQALGLAPLPSGAIGAGSSGAPASGAPAATKAGSEGAKGAEASASAGQGGESPLDVKADTAAVLQHVLDLVLGGITDDEARKAVHAEYQKLKAAFDKADKLGTVKAKVAAYQAVLPQAQALQARADGIRATFAMLEALATPLVEPARAAIGKIGGPARGPLTASLDGLVTDALKAARAADSAGLQSTIQPKLVKLHQIATQLPKRSAEIDAGIAAAAKVLLALDRKKASELLARLAALQNAKATGWPAGDTLGAITASFDGLLAEAKALQAAGSAMQDERELGVVQKRLDELKPRLDRADDTGMPSYVEQRQNNVRVLLQTVQGHMAEKDKAAVLKSLGTLTLALGDMEGMRERWSAYRRKFDAAHDGPVKAALALALKPADFAGSRDKQLAQTQHAIEESAKDGVFDPALRLIDTWIAQAQAWSRAQTAYTSLHGKSPDVGKLEDLAHLPGGDKVLDQLVADLPPETTPQVLVTALKARYGVDLVQYGKLKQKADPTDPTKTVPTMDVDHDTKEDPSKPDPEQVVDLEGLYKVLGTMPKKDVGYVERIEHVTKDKNAATFEAGLFTDTIALHCGRPGDDSTTEFNVDGQVVPEGEHVAPGCEPTAGPAKYFDFTVLHEVGHAVDDARGIMSGDRAKDAGWGSPGTGHIAEKIAGQVRYDKSYIEAMLDDKASKPPASKPKPPKGRAEADWEAARVKAETWVSDIRVGNKLWGNAAMAKARAIEGIVYHEAYDGDWVSYRYAARSTGITGYQFRAPAEWFAELYAAYHSGKLNPKHPATQWLAKLKAESTSS